MSDVAAIIPAAGLSSRMGAFKPLLPLGKSTVLAHAITAFRANGIKPILVVTGKRADEVAKAARRFKAKPVHNSEYEQGMYTSVLAGVRALDPLVPGFFMLPADIPLVRPRTVARLLAQWRENPCPVLYPRFQGQRGHPPLISGALIPDILAHDGRGGLRTVLERHNKDARDVDVPDFGTVLDLDLPGDYKLAQTLADTEYPTEAECEQLLRMHAVSDHIQGHCRAVARVAVALCRRLNARGADLDPALVRGAALVHDIGKGTKRHEAVGAELLHGYGFHAAADIVGAHFDLELGDDEPVTEREVVFLADKLVRCHSAVPLEARYLEKLDVYRHEPGAEEAILGRLGRAKALLARFDREMGVSAETVAKEALS